MNRKTFSKEEMEILSENPYVENVSSTSITYSDKFKKDYMDLRRNGSKPTGIFREFGFDTGILGQQRIDALDKRLRKKEKSGTSLKDQRKNSSGRHEKRDIEEMSDKEKILNLRSENEYLRQANAFLKKNIVLQERHISKKSKH